MNSKDGSSDGTSNYSMNLLMYSKKTYDSLTTKKKWGAVDASETTHRNRVFAIGKTNNSIGYTSLSHTNGHVVNDALRRVRSGGLTAPKKKGLHK
jgi:ABC-type phosphate transport system substrate-binding protein